jgi:hypothetical protein
MAGLYIRNNLGEENLNLTDAVQKLYKTGINNDLRLFRFAKSLFSEVRSPYIFDGTISQDAEIKGFFNESFTTSDNKLINRTKFLTNKYTFSSDNFVWFERINNSGSFQLDRRPSFYSVSLKGNVTAGSSPDTIKLDSSDSKVLSSSINRLIGKSSDLVTTYTYFILGGTINSGADFKISDSLDGPELTGSNLTTAIANLATTREASVKYLRPEGSPIVVSENGSIVSLEVEAVGSNYDIETFHENNSFISGRTYIISAVGDMDWTAVGVSSGVTPVRGLSFTASASGDGDSTKTGKASTILQDSDYTGDNDTLPIQVNLLGEKSLASDAIAEVYLKKEGGLDVTKKPKVITGGSGYFEDEKLIILPHCKENRYGEFENSFTTQCKIYPEIGNRLIYTNFKYDVIGDGLGTPDESTIEIGQKAALYGEKYTYQVKGSTEEGFFLYNVDDEEFVYLGDFYNTQADMPSASNDEPLLLMRRKDVITDINLLNISSLDSTSFIFTHDDFESFKSEANLANRLRARTLEVKEVRNSFKYVVQNATRQRKVEDALNPLSTQYNIFEGKNFDSTFRYILRDPDGVLDATGSNEVTFSDLASLTATDQVEVERAGEQIICPGIYLKSGDKFIRAFSSDAKPFSSRKGSFRTLSPSIYELTSGNYNTGSFSLVTQGNGRYSLSASFYKGGTSEIIKGFDSYIGTLVQNLSRDVKYGGFAFSTEKTIEDIGSVKGFPLISYDFEGVTYNTKFLYVPTT